MELEGRVLDVWHNGPSLFIKVDAAPEPEVIVMPDMVGDETDMINYSLALGKQRIKYIETEQNGVLTKTVKIRSGYFQHEYVRQIDRDFG